MLNKHGRVYAGFMADPILRRHWWVWSAMRDRCNNPKAKHYKDYGMRGITVCDRWQLSFHDFIADMGLRPTNRHTLERRDNDLGYNPSNCVWATQSEQSKNKRAYKKASDLPAGVLVSGGKYAARIKVDGNRIFLGPFVTIADAVEAVSEARLKYGFSPKHGMPRSNAAGGTEA